MDFHFSVPADDFSQAGEISVKVKHELEKMDYPKSLIRRIAVSMYEAEINMVIHAGGGEIFVAITDDKIVVQMSDNGPGITDVKKAMEEGFSTASEDIHEYGFGAGMGLANIKRNCDMLDIISPPEGGTSIVMTFFITKEDK